jgi:hypothetical protein
MNQKKVKKIEVDPHHGAEIGLLGLVSSEPLYKITVLINSTIGCTLRKSDSVITRTSEGIEESFTRFTDISDLPHSWISIIANRTENATLIRKLPNIDFVIACFDESAKTTFEEMAAKLRSMKLINAVFMIDISTIDKSVHNAMITVY